MLQKVINNHFRISQEQKYQGDYGKRLGQSFLKTMVWYFMITTSNYNFSCVITKLLSKFIRNILTHCIEYKTFSANVLTLKVVLYKPNV